MKQKLIRPLLAGALILSLTACAPAAETAPSSAPSADASAPSETASPSPSPILPPEAPPVETAPAQSLPTQTPPAQTNPPEPEESTPAQTGQTWLEAYRILLEDLAHVEQQEGLDLYGDRWREAAVYDVDKDGVPELFFKSGFCEADFETVCYAFRNGRAEAIGQFGSGHTALFTWPEQNAILVWHAQMGVSDMYEYSIIDGRLVCVQTVFSEEVPRSPYTEVNEIVPGSVRVTDYLGTFSEIWENISSDWSEPA